jgi:glycerol-3-phosphate acyltransferase PlsX
LKKKLDMRNVNGGVFLGLNGVVIKSHGGSDAIGTARAVETAYVMARHQLLSKIRNSVPLLHQEFHRQPGLQRQAAPAAASSES